MLFKESSLIASIFTKKFGKIKVLAKGVRRPKSKLCGALELFNLDEIIFYKRELKELYTLSDAVVIDDFEKVRAHPRKVNAGMVLCEFFEKTLPLEEIDSHAYTLLLNFLKELQDIDKAAIKPLTYYYLLKTLSGAGVRPHFENCVRCHEPIKYDNKNIDFDDTVIFLSNKTVNTLRRIYKDEDIEMCKESISEIETFIPNYLYYHLNNLVLNSLKHLSDYSDKK
jgi:DNA repair protein RecO (recombination protein O)